MVIAGADFILVPAFYEPCGMIQMYCMKYGTIPIVHKTGGLADTVVGIDLEKNKGNGFVFEKYNTRDLLRVIKSAIKIYKKAEQFKEIKVRIMKEDYSWDNSTEQYIEIYNRIVAPFF